MRSSVPWGAKRLRHMGLFAALVLSALAAWPLLSVPGLVNTRAGGDSPFLLQRLYELQVNLRAGLLPARWMPDAAYGLGYPFFSYYASLPYYLGARLSLAGAGVLWALKLTQLLGFLGAAAAMYALVDALLDDQAAAFLAATAYTFAPFHMVNVYVRGDSLCEFYAFVFYPLILWSIVRLRRGPTAGNLTLLALSYAGLMVTHNISALIFSPLAGLALLWAALSAPRARLRVLLAGALGVLLGAALSAWFWVPALLERDAVSLTNMTTGYFGYTGHFRSRDLVQQALLFDYTIDTQRTPFVVGGLQAGLTVAGLATLLLSWLWRRRFHGSDLGLVFLLAYAIWPITPSSSVLWERVPLLPMIQFPWRFLSIVSLGTALTAGVALSRVRGRQWLAAGLGLALAVSALALLQPEPLPLAEADVTSERLQLYEHLTGNIGSTVRAEYLPQTAIPRPYTAAQLLSGEPHPEPLAAEGSLVGSQLQSAGPTHQVWEVTVGEPETRLVFQTYAFPGWQATVDGQPATIDPTVGNGRIAVEVDEGRHEVALQLGPTPLRADCERLSLAAGVAVLGLALLALWRSRRHWRGLVLGLAIVAGTVGLGALLGSLAARAGPQQQALATETMDFLRLPYLHPNPQGVSFGPSVRLLGYELAPREARAGDVVHLRLHWQSTGSDPLQAVVRLTTAAEPLFQVPGFATSRAPLEAATEHALTVPPEVAPGLALLAVEVRGPQGALSPRTHQGAGLGTTYLAPVRVLPPTPAPHLAAIGKLGKSVDLLHASVNQHGADALSVRVTWRPRVPLPEDYVATVHLLDPDGRPVPGAGLDVQPRYGLYPSSLWSVGSPVADFYELRLPRGTAPGPGYQVEVGLYQARTLAPLGSVRILGVTLRDPTLDPNALVLHTFEGGLALSAWQLEREEVADGETLTARLQWKAEDAPLSDATCRLSLHDEQGQEVASALAPLSPHYPPSQWPLHALVSTHLHLHVPPGTPAGRYHLELQLQDAHGRSLGHWSPPGEVRVRAAERRAQLPAFAHPVGVDYGGLIRLPGYDLERSAGQIAVTLHWQALRPPGRSYKIFLHCFDPASEKIVAQRDAFPLENTYMTSRWAAGEVVSDRLVLDMRDVPPGRYQLAVGWYDPATSERLEPVGDAARISHRRVLLQQIEW